jgi:hypothetical protein
MSVTCTVPSPVMQMFAFENNTGQLGTTGKALEMWTAGSKTHRTNVAVYHTLEVDVSQSACNWHTKSK